jgi:hypothetical protein
MRLTYYKVISGGKPMSTKEIKVPELEAPRPMSTPELAKNGAMTKGSFQMRDLILLMEKDWPDEKTLIENSDQEYDEHPAIIPVGLELGNVTPKMHSITMKWKSRPLVRVYYGYENVEQRLVFNAGTEVLIPKEEQDELIKEFEAYTASAETD